MKLKNQFILRTVADKTVAIAVELEGEKTDNVITLNSTGAFIFDLVNKGSDRDQIIAAFFKEYDVTKDEAAAAVDNFIESLKNSGLLED